MKSAIIDGRKNDEFFVSIPNIRIPNETKTTMLNKAFSAVYFTSPQKRKYQNRKT